MDHEIRTARKTVCNRSLPYAVWDEIEKFTPVRIALDINYSSVSRTGKKVLVTSPTTSRPHTVVGLLGDPRW